MTKLAEPIGSTEDSTYHGQTMCADTWSQSLNFLDGSLLYLNAGMSMLRELSRSGSAPGPVLLASTELLRSFDRFSATLAASRGTKFPPSTGPTTGKNLLG